MKTSIYMRKYYSHMFIKHDSFEKTLRKDTDIKGFFTTKFILLFFNIAYSYVMNGNYNTFNFPYKTLKLYRSGNYKYPRGDKSGNGFVRFIATRSKDTYSLEKKIYKDIDKTKKEINTKREAYERNLRSSREYYWKNKARLQHTGA